MTTECWTAKSRVSFARSLCCSTATDTTDDDTMQRGDCRGNARTCIEELRARQACAAESALCMPTDASRCAIWRWRLLSSTASWSTIPRRPTPAAARYNAAGQPKPPAPITSTPALHSRPCAAHTAHWQTSRCVLSQLLFSQAIMGWGWW